MDGQDIPLFQYRTQTKPFTNDNWSSGLCGCCGQNGNPGFFCLACCCGGIAQGILLEDLGIVSSCACPVALYMLLEGVTGRSALLLILTSLRVSLSKKLGRKEGPCCSFCISCCCYPCAVAQIHRDVMDPERGYVFKTPEKFEDKVNGFLGGISRDMKPESHTQPFTKNGM
jgi:Cys-rich protein (TIGR01571 family)